MSAVNSALRSIIIGKKDFCCLCLKPNQEDILRIDDNITAKINNNELSINIAEVLSSVLGEERLNYINTFNTLCELCIQSAITCYQFVQSCQKNIADLTGIVDRLVNSLDNTSDNVYSSQSLFVSLNLNECTSKHFYDMKSIGNTPQAALRRFRSLNAMEKIRTEDKIVIKEEETINYEEARDSQSLLNIFCSRISSDPEIFKCEECHKEYQNVYSLKKHHINAHAPKVYKCPECPKKYGSAAILRTHKTETHSSFVCSECGKIFSNKSTLKMHEFSHKVTVVCPDCGRVYKNKYTYKKHIEHNVCGRESRAHPSEAKFTCDYCNKKYTQKMSLRVHIQHEHGNYKSHICEWCGKKFWAPSRLKAHIVKHTQEKNFTCVLCDGKFVSKESLLYHTRTHTGDKPYKCPHCDSKFLSASRRSVHVKNRHKGGAYQCDVCHMQFKSKSCLQKHKKIHDTSEDKLTDSNVSKTVNKRYDAIKPNNNIEMEELWKINYVSLQNILEPGMIDIHNYKNEVIQLSTDNIYLDVPDDANEYLILGT